MFHRVVMRAFLCASIADLCACLTDQINEFAIAPHIGHGESAHVRAIHIKLYAACQVRKIFFLQARNRAFIAREGAGIAGIDARPHLFVHGCLLGKVRKYRIRRDFASDHAYKAEFQHTGVPSLAG